MKSINSWIAIHIIIKVGGRWLLKPLLTFFVIVYHRWERLRLRAFLHHHELDYMEKLTRVPKTIYLINAIERLLNS